MHGITFIYTVLEQSRSTSFPRQFQESMARAKQVAAYVCLFVFLLLLAARTKGQKERPLRWVTKRTALQYLTTDMTDMDHFKSDELNPMLIERISDTPGNVAVREHIKTRLLNLGWTVEEDAFEDTTPFGRKHFVNIIATLHPQRAQRTVVACHYDSKDMKTKSNITFIAAIDSAVPCAIMLESAKQLDCLLRKGPQDDNAVSDLGLQFVFFDGEEAFERWSERDSVYGARHLADKWDKESRLSSIREFILLDLIGSTDTVFKDLFPATSTLFQHLKKAEKHLRDNNMLSEGHTSTMFLGKGPSFNIEDDHIPFLRRGVDILHMIPFPFPKVWHKEIDNGDHLDFAFIDNFSRIFRVFLSNLLHLQPENIGCRKK